jgi:hemolysin-activating ACP:hemolysin acyltransferase
MIFRQTKKQEASSKAAPSLGAGNGDTAPPTAKAESVTRPRDARQARMGQVFAQVVAVLMRDTNFRNMRLADLEWLVLPPVMAGQFKFGHAMRPADKTQQGGISVPVAVALWARVSPEVDKGLSEALDKPVHLRPNQWASGNILWLMAAAGDPRAKPHFLKQLAETEFKEQHVKMRLRGPDGKVVIKALDQTK